MMAWKSLSATYANLTRCVLAWSLVLSPIAAARAAAPSAAEYLTPASVGAVTVRLSEAAQTDAMQPLPIEVADAAAKKYLGVPLEAIERVTVVIEPPAGMMPLYAVVINSTEAVSLVSLRPELTEHTTLGELAGRPMLESQQPMAPSICLLDDNTLAFGAKPVLKRLIERDPSVKSKLAVAMNAKGGAENHLHAAVMFEPLRGLIQMGMSQAMQDAPPETHKYFQAVELLSGAILTADLSFQRDSSLTVYANDESDGDRLNGLIEEGIADMRAQTLESPQYLEMAASDDPVQQAMAQYAERSFGGQVDAFKPRRAGSKAFVLGEVRTGEYPGTMASVAIIGVLVALLLPAVQAAREAARRNQSMNNTKQIMLALHNYHDVRRSFPPHAVYSEEGTPLLSWRVAILPFIEQQALYERFNLDEPWDSPNNKPLLAEMPEVFIDPSSPALETAGGKTHYLGVAGKECLFDGSQQGVSLREVSDGLSRTIMVVQVNDENAVEWTKPADFDFEAKQADPISAIGRLHPGAFLAGFADGHIQAVPIDTPAETLRNLFTKAGGEVVEVP